MYVKKDYSLIALCESLKRGSDQRKAKFERSLSRMTLELLSTAFRFHSSGGSADKKLTGIIATAGLSDR